MHELVTQDEIKHLKTNPRELSWKDLVPGKGLAVPLAIIELKSGYLVSYTIDTIFPNKPDIKVEHLIVGAKKFEPDPSDMDEIADLILGDCFRTPAEWVFSKNEACYIKIRGLDNKAMQEFREAGIECGVAAIEVRK